MGVYMEQSRKGRSAEQLMFMSGAKLPMMREASSCVAWLNRFGIEVIEYLMPLQSFTVIGSHSRFEDDANNEKLIRTKVAKYPCFGNILEK